MVYFNHFNIGGDYMSSSIVKIDKHTVNITLTRGDYFASYVGMTKNDEPYTPVDGSLRIAVKRRYTDDDEKALINKEIPLSTLLLELESADTKNLRFGEYDYDIQYTDVNGRPDTFIEGKLILTKEVL